MKDESTIADRAELGVPHARPSHAPRRAAVVGGVAQAAAWELGRRVYPLIRVAD